MRAKRWIGLVAALCLLATALTGIAATAAAKYYITVDITNQIVTVYDNGTTSRSGIVCQMICSSGKSGTPTPTGTFTLPSKNYASERTEWYYFSKYNCYAKWATRIRGGILFHSVLYTAGKVGPTRSSVNALGSRASHGCVRLRVKDARWIALNCPAGTKCRIYYSGKTNSDLRKRLLDHSFYRSSETYEAFLGEEDGFRVLLQGMTGERVRKLQARLKALGFLNDTVDGIFGSKTAKAVKYFQKACGVKQTGKVNEALWNRAFADDAPTGTYVTLSKGMSGPAVTVLQRGLKALKLYDGAADGSYDAAVARAVKDFQGYYDYTANGKANQAVQKDVIARAKALAERFGDEPYRLVITTEETAMGRVKGKSGTKLKAKASAGSKTLAKLKKGAEVEVLSKGKSWTKALSGKKKGYVRNKAMTFFTRTKTTLSYVSESEPDPTPTPTATPEVSLPTPTPTATPEVSLPTPTPTPTPEVSLPEPTATPDAGDVRAIPAEDAVAEVEAELGGTGLPRYAIITADDTPLYAAPEAEGAAVLRRLDAGEALEVADVLADWIAVRVDGATGYVPADAALLADALPEPAATPEADGNGGGTLEMGDEPTPEPPGPVWVALEIEEEGENDAD